jgi:hypothetical protein
MHHYYPPHTHTHTHIHTQSNKNQSKRNWHQQVHFSKPLARLRNSTENACTVKLSSINFHPHPPPQKKKKNSKIKFHLPEENNMTSTKFTLQNHWQSYIMLLKIKKK